MTQRQNSVRFFVIYHVLLGVALAFGIPIVLASLDDWQPESIEGPVEVTAMTMSEAVSDLDVPVGTPPPSLQNQTSSDDAPTGAVEAAKGLVDAWTQQRTPFKRLNTDDPRTLVDFGGDHVWIVVSDPTDAGWRTRTIGRAARRLSVESLSSLTGMERIRYTVEVMQLNPYSISHHTKPTDLPAWSVFSQCPTRDIHWKVAVQQQFGWPCRSAYSTLWLESVGGKGRHSGYAQMPEFGQIDDLPTRALLIAGKNADGTRKTTRHIPLGIIPTGLIINALVYACATFAFSNLIGFCRRRLRLARGRCPACRYQLDKNTTTGCPECGWNRD